MNFSLLGVFAAGLLTFISPCVLPMAPILIANLISVKDASRFDRFKATLWFTLGFSIVFILMGLSLPALTALMGGAKPILVGLGGALLALFGLRMMGALGGGSLASFLTRTFQFPQFTSWVPKGLQGFAFGALFGLTWTPCVGPVLGGVLTYVASQELAPKEGALLLGFFALGVSIPFLLLAIASDYVTPLLGKLKRHLPKVEYAAGLGLFLFGFFVISQARLQDFVLRNSSDTQVVAIDDRGRSVQLGEGKLGANRMVFFYSENCPVCHAMERYLPEFEKRCQSENFELVRINVDRPENAYAAQKFAVNAVPTISVLNEKGSELVHLVGYQTEGRLQEAARTVTHLTCQSKILDINPFLIPELQDGQTCIVGNSC